MYTDAVINITNLRLRTFIGFNPEEQQKKQDIIINIEICHAVSQEGLNDDISHALDYKKITKQVIHYVESNCFMLLEKLTHDVLNIVSVHSRVNHAKVSVDKPHALRFADSVSLTLEYKGNNNDQ